MILIGPVGAGAQELDVAHFDGVASTDRSNHPRHDIGSAAAARSVAGIVQVDAVQGGGEAIAVALAPNLAIGQDVDAGPLHVADGDQRRVVLGLFEKWLGDAPDIPRPDARRQPTQELSRSTSQSGCG